MMRIVQIVSAEEGGFFRLFGLDEDGGLWEFHREMKPTKNWAGRTQGWGFCCSSETRSVDISALGQEGVQK